MKRLGGGVGVRLAFAGALTIVLLIVVGGAMGSRADSGGERIGTPWTGVAGLQRTTAAITAAPATAEQSAATPQTVSPIGRAARDRSPNPGSPLRSAAVKVGKALAGEKLAVASSFTGTTLPESGFVPPDSMGAAGPSQFLVVVNGRIKVFSKTGTVGSLNTSLDGFFASVRTPGQFTTDPEVRYDSLSGRWFVTCVDTAPMNNRILLAVSDSGTITGSTVWTFFQFQQNLVSPAGDANNVADFPTLGIDANALYVGANMADSNGNIVNATLFVIRKSSVTGAGPIVVSAFRNLDNAPSYSAGPFSPQGASNDDPAATSGYVVGVDFAFFGLLDVLRVGSPGGTPTLSGNLQVSVPQTFFPKTVTVVGSSKPLDAGDDRLSAVSIVGGALYAVQNIGVDSTGNASSSPTRDAVRWYQLGNLASTPSLTRSGSIYDPSGAATSYWMPSIAVSGQGHAVIGMNIGSTTTHADAAVSSMLSGASSFPLPILYTSSHFSYDPSFDTGNPFYRWGDYSHTSVDPCDQQTFWTIQEYVDSPNSWGVQVGRIPAPPPATPSSTSPGSVAAGQASANVTLTGTSSSGSGFWDPGSGSCRIAAAVDAGVTVNSITYTDPTHVTLNVSTTGATADLHTVTITNPDGQTASAAVLVVSKASPTISTALSASTITLGAGIHDTAALTGATSGAAGTVTYNAYSGTTCSGGPLFTDPETVTNGVVPNSSTFTPSAAGSYSWQAVYGGDANNNGAASVCSTEQLTVNKTTPTISTALSQSVVPVATPVHDTATLSGATAGAAGSVTYSVYSNSACTGVPFFTDVEVVTSAVVPNSASFTPLALGTYYWQAVYSGDANNNSVGSSCSSELLYVATLPGAPIGIYAIAGNAQASVTFSAPASNGGAPVTSYTVTASPGGQTGSGSGHTVVVSGLTNGVMYTFTVTATNGIGTGPSSIASNPVTATTATRPAPPPPPPPAGPMPTVPGLTVPGGVRQPPPGQ